MYPSDVHTIYKLMPHCTSGEEIGLFYSIDMFSSEFNYIYKYVTNARHKSTQYKYVRVGVMGVCYMRFFLATKLQHLQTALKIKVM